MFTKKKESVKIDPVQRELIENAQRRVKQKKNLFRHFVIFLAGAVILIILNLVLDFGKDIRPLDVDWFVWAIIIWFFFFLIHFLNVFLLSSLMSKKWENEQVERLVDKQKAKIAQLQNTVEIENPLPEKKSPLLRPNHPLDL
ncbi:MAG: 2TM domain-containing protein [Leeuwenhoekiella sp.]